MADLEAYYDLSSLLALREVLREVGEAPDPQIRFLSPAGGPTPRRLALLPGSFNPPTVAHLALARFVLDRDVVDEVDFVLATRTVNKERLEGLALDDRLLLLLRLTHEQADLGVSVVNRGLYVDQAELARAAMIGLDRLWFVVGYDKIVQIFDSRYYVDREAALGRLFGLASFLVAPRGDQDSSDLDTLLELPENRQFAHRVLPLPLPPKYRDVSSSRLRARAATTGSFPDVPPVVSEFLEETGAFASPVRRPNSEEVDRYAVRERVVDLVESGNLPKPSPREFRDLVQYGTTIDAIGTGVAE